MSHHARMLHMLIESYYLTYRQPEADSCWRSIKTVAAMLIAGTYKD